MREFFCRSYYKRHATRIYPFYFTIIIFALLMIIALFTAFFYRVLHHAGMTFFGLLMIYFISIFEFSYRFMKKKRLFDKGGYQFGKNSEYYFRKVNRLIWVDVAMAMACLGYLVINKIPLNLESIHENYWIWYAVLLFLLAFEPFDKIISGYNENKFISGIYIVDYSDIVEIKVIKKKETMIGRVCEIELFDSSGKVGVDRVFEDDLVYLKNIVLLY